MFCLCDFQSIWLTVIIESVVKNTKKYSERYIDLHEIVYVLEISLCFVVMIVIFVSTVKSSSPFSMTHNPTKFPCISNNKSYSSGFFSGVFFLILQNI